MSERETDPQLDPAAVRTIVPDLTALERLAAAVLTTTGGVLSGLGPEVPSGAITELDTARGDLDVCRSHLPDPDERGIADFDALRVHSPGGTAAEKLLSAHLLTGFAADVILEFSKFAQDEAGATSLSQRIAEWEKPQAAMRRTLAAWFDAEPKQVDLLAMWGRRIAGDAAVWVREVCGIAPGTSPDEVLPGSSATFERTTSVLFAQHSRRMNALGLAA